MRFHDRQTQKHSVPPFQYIRFIDCTLRGYRLKEVDGAISPPQHRTWGQAGSVAIGACPAALPNKLWDPWRSWWWHRAGATTRLKKKKSQAIAAHFCKAACGTAPGLLLNLLDAFQEDFPAFAVLTQRRSLGTCLV